jgi:hypothetical protein
MADLVSSSEVSFLHHLSLAYDLFLRLLFRYLLLSPRLYLQRSSELSGPLGPALSLPRSGLYVIVSGLPADFDLRLVLLDLPGLSWFLDLCRGGPS